MLAITNATIIDGTGHDPIENGTLLIDGERISAVGKQVAIPRATTVIDARGGSVLPGLIDTHVHFTEDLNVLANLFTPPSLYLLQAIPRMKATLDAGVTTVRDAGGTPAGVKMAVEQGIVPGPRMQVAVSLIAQTGGHGDGYFPCCANMNFFLGAHFKDVPNGIADGVEEIRKTTREILRAGADWIKLSTTGGVLSTLDAPTSPQLTVEEIATAVYEAAAQEKHCMAHAQGTRGIKNALLAGVASIEHGIYLDDETIQLMLQKDAYLVPTLVAPLDVIEFSQNHPDLLTPMIAAKASALIEAHRLSFHHALEAGVKIAMGSDAGISHHGENGRELQLMVENGMTPMQAIQASTYHASRLLHLDKHLGTLEEGKLADVILVTADVLQDISAIANPAHVQLVLKDGQSVKNQLHQ
jgi:imidazolonepropionase-like amidohydrolase